MAPHEINVEDIERLRDQVAELKISVRSLQQPKSGGPGIYYIVCVILSCLCLVFAIANERHNAHLEKMAIDFINTYEIIEISQ